MNPAHIVFLEILIYGLIGLPFAYLFDRDGYLFYLTRNVSEALVIQAYLWTLYAFLTMFIIYFVLKLDRQIKNYQKRELIHFSKQTYLKLWVFSFAATMICTVVLFVQAGFSHPGFSAMNLDATEYAIKRIVTAKTINMNIYNVGINFFAVFALTISLFIIKNIWLSVLTIIMTFILVTFSLAKAPMSNAIILLMIVYMFISRPSWRVIIISGALSMVFVGMMFLVSDMVSDSKLLGFAITKRAFYGQFADLPYYLDLFNYQKVGFASLLPPYIQSILEISEQSASRLVMEYSNPAAVLLGSAGVANTIFIGEAYAYAGIAGIIIVPFWVMANYVVVISIFTKSNKNIFTVFLFAYLFYRMMDALFSGLSYFILSGIQIVLVAYLYFSIMKYLSVRRKSNFPRDVC